MLDLARQHAPGAEEFRKLVLPDDPIPTADATVSVGHVLSYLPDEESVTRALRATARALRPEGVLAIDLCDLEWGRAWANQSPKVWRSDDWVLMTEFSCHSPDRYVRTMTTFARNADGTWRRDDETTTTCSSTRPGSPRSWPRRESRCRSRRASEARNSLSAWWRSSGAAPPSWWIQGAMGRSGRGVDARACRACPRPGAEDVSAGQISPVLPWPPEGPLSA
jgi:SAM-dependent methyltransferase